MTRFEKWRSELTAEKAATTLNCCDVCPAYDEGRCFGTAESNEECRSFFINWASEEVSDD